MMPVANERASKSKRGSLINGLFLAVRIRKRTNTSRVIRAYVSTPKFVTKMQTTIRINFLIAITISQK
jgi:hypothetical protein